MVNPGFRVPLRLRRPVGRAPRHVRVNDERECVDGLSPVLDRTSDTTPLEMVSCEKNVNPQGDLHFRFCLVTPFDFEVI